MSPRPAAARRVLATSPFDRTPPTDGTTYALGDRVSHDRHGLGRVIGGEPGVDVVVDFGSSNLVRVNLPSAMLCKVTTDD